MNEFIIRNGAIIYGTLDVKSNNITNSDVNGNLNLVTNGTGKINLDGSYWPTANSSGFLQNDGNGNLTWQLAGGAGTVTSVAVSSSTGLNVSGSPVTTSGTISLTLDSSLQNFVNSGTGLVVKNGTSIVSRNILGGTAVNVQNANGVAGDITINVLENSLSLNNLSGTLSVGKGGTGNTTFTTNSILIGNGTSALNTITPPGSPNVFLKYNGSSFVWDTVSGAGLTVQDEGSDQGTSGGITTINFTGAGVTATGSGSTATVNISGGGSSSVIQFRVLYTNGVIDASPNHIDNVSGISAANIIRDGNTQITIAHGLGKFLGNVSCYGNSPVGYRHTTPNGASTSQYTALSPDANSLTLYQLTPGNTGVTTTGTGYLWVRIINP
jgi:hypothetical protein